MLNVATRVAVLYTTVDVISVLVDVVLNSMVLVPIVVGFMASLKVTATAIVGATLVAPLAGLTEVTVGRVVSEPVPVLKVEVKFVAKALPAISLTRGSAVPPLTVRVKVVDDARVEEGVNVARRVAPSYVTVEAIKVFAEFLN